MELIGAAPGSMWEALDTPAIRHLGVWVDDIKEESRRLQGRGLNPSGMRSQSKRENPFTSHSPNASRHRFDAADDREAVEQLDQREESLPR